MSRNTVEDDLEIFLVVLRNWNGETPSFHDLLVASCQHAAVQQGLRHGEAVFVNDIADRTGLAEPYIRRLIANDVPCGEGIQRMLIAHVADYLDEQYV